MSHARSLAGTALRSALLLAAGLLAVLLAALWFVRRELPVAVQSLRTELATDRQRRDDELLQGVSSALADGATQAREQFESALEALRQDQAAERARWQQELEAARRAQQELLQEQERLRGESLAAGSVAANLQEDLVVARAESARRLVENSRLLEQLLDRDRRLQALQEQVTSIAERPENNSTGSILDSGHTSALGLVQSLAGLTRTAGAERFQLIEVGALHEGGLQNLVFRWAPDPEAAWQLLRAGTSALQISAGQMCLTLTAVSAADGASLPDVEVPLPNFAAASWSALGLAVPDRWTSLQRTRTALAALTQPAGYRVMRLEGWDGHELLGLELHQEDSAGQTLRILKAQRAEVLPMGPALELREGTVTSGGEERPFFKDLFRLQLPGGDFGAWLTGTRETAP
ncbi:MAG: hypothetical protein ACT4PU_10450 [Planctomycetota bacterium]